MKKKIFITILFLILLVIQFYTIYRVDSLESKVYTKQTQDIEKSKELKVEKLEKKKTEYDTFNDYIYVFLMENDKVCYSPSSITPKLVLENAVH